MNDILSLSLLEHQNEFVVISENRTVIMRYAYLTYVTLFATKLRDIRASSVTA